MEEKKDIEEQQELELPEKPEYGLPASWNTGSVGLENRRKAMASHQTKHGMFSGVPIICRGQDCPYYETCWIPDMDLQIGERCPIEIAAIIDRFDKYCEELNVDPEVDSVDAGFIKDIVDIEVTMIRADNLLAQKGTFIEDTVAGVTPQGKSIVRPEIHKAAEFKEQLREKKIKLLNQLNATRKDKKADNIGSQDPSSVAARIIARVNELKKNKTILDVDPESGDIIGSSEEEEQS